MQENGEEILGHLGRALRKKETNTQTRKLGLHTEEFGWGESRATSSIAPEHRPCQERGDKKRQGIKWRGNQVEGEMPESWLTDTLNWKHLERSRNDAESQIGKQDTSKGL